MKKVQNEIEKIRQAFADYVSSEGCGCCQSPEAHQKAAAKLAKLLSVEPYSDGSGWNFYKYKTQKK